MWRRSETSFMMTRRSRHSRRIEPINRSMYGLPVDPKSFSMPGDYGIRLDEQEAVAPLGPEPGENDPQDPIRCAKPDPSLITSLQDNELVA
jgi:hypothetical protein